MALEVLGVLVGFHVRPQVGSVSEPFAALVAAEGFLAGVEARVVLQQPGAREGLGTNFALEVANVCLEVHGEGGHAHVQLVADVASLGIFHREGLMCLPVPGQVGGGGEQFATIRALFFRRMLLLCRVTAEHVNDKL